MQKKFTKVSQTLRKFSMKILSPFGPKLAKIKVPKSILDKINLEVDKIIKNKSRVKKNDYSKRVVGQVYQEIELPKNFINKVIKKFLSKNISNYLKKSINKSPKKITIKNFWVVRQFKNEYNPIHWHSGHVSGAGFLKVPKDLGSYVQNKDEKKYQGGTLNLVHGSRQFLSHSTKVIRPEVGDFYFFPSYLMHTVYPFRGNDEERRSISFNANIDDEFYKITNERE